MKILFTYDNPLPNTRADGEVFLETVKALKKYFPDSSLLLPLKSHQTPVSLEEKYGIRVIDSKALAIPVFFRHLYNCIMLRFHKDFREADVLYTRNFLIAWVSTLLGKPTVYDHFQALTDHIPPLTFLVLQFIHRPSFLFYACHSQYLQQRYLQLGCPAEKIIVVRNGFNPGRLKNLPDQAKARSLLNIPNHKPVILYSGRVNLVKGLNVILDAAKCLPDHLFILVGKEQENAITEAAKNIPNVLLRPWETNETKLATYLKAADILLIPPSTEPMSVNGSTVLPLKTFFYLGSGGVIVAGALPDIMELLEDNKNAKLVPPDNPEALAKTLKKLTADPKEMERLRQNAAETGKDLTWDKRAERLSLLIKDRLSHPHHSSYSWLTKGDIKWASIFKKSCLWFLHLLSGKGYMLPSQILPAKKQD